MTPETEQITPNWFRFGRVSAGGAGIPPYPLEKTGNESFRIGSDFPAGTITGPGVRNRFGSESD
ncbi:hypothetical protein [Rhizobium sp. LCM 4573]|uniref:hypothetical protein n=1 Tax=Rhizobium sp. LCM 4573 TaxID=1848291 RepID=UPI0008D9292A|nr:hypothetical protein [Rhizobium sp. LCM 4573]OHV80804.1 hypothetical protein LCM4573_23500 [Rhizobium sp. LCM 4573]